MAVSKRRQAEATDYSMEEKIFALYDLQVIDSQVDEINKLKGALPIEVQDLEDELAGIQTRIDNIQESIEELNMLTKQRKAEIEESKAQITKYTEQQNNVRNNREFDSLSKEIEYQELEIQLCEKHLKEYTVELKIKKSNLEDAEAVLAGRKADFKAKQDELTSIDKETEVDIKRLMVLSDKAQSKIDERLLSAYRRIRSNVHNGLAVVTVERNACGGCFNRIPPQRQADIRTNKKIIVCEYCGRILVPNELEGEEE